MWTDYNLDLDILDSLTPSQELGDPRSSEAEGTTVNDGTTWSDGWTGTVMSGYNYTESFDGVLGSDPNNSTGRFECQSNNNLD